MRVVPAFSMKSKTAIAVSLRRPGPLAATAALECRTAHQMGDSLAPYAGSLQRTENPDPGLVLMTPGAGVRSPPPLPSKPQEPEGSGGFRVSGSSCAVGIQSGLRGAATEQVRRHFALTNLEWAG